MQRQPLRQVMYRERWSVTQLAAEVGVSTGHLRSVIEGGTAPRDELRDRLPGILGVPVDELFTPDLLARRWSGTRGTQGGRTKAGESR